MKKILLIAAAIMILVPFTVNAEMIAINDMAMEEITGQASLGLTVAPGDLNIEASTGSVDVDLAMGMIGATANASVTLDNSAGTQFIGFDTATMALTADLGGLALTSDANLDVTAVGLTMLSLDVVDANVTVNSLRATVGLDL